MRPFHRTLCTNPEASRAPADAGRGYANLAGDVIGIRVAQAFDRIDGDLVNLLRRFGGDLLDVHPALGARHQHDPLRHAVDDHADVELLTNVRALLDQQAPHLLARRPGLMRHELHAENFSREVANVIERFRELDAPALAATPRVNLRLDDPNGTAERLRRLDRVVDGKGRHAARYRHP
jgi:hypothetical protein